MLAYNSVVWEFGNPGPDDQSDVGLYEPIKADPSLAVGWSLTAGAIKPCGVVQNSNCYVGPDGSERLFDQSPSANYYRTSDGSQLLLHSLGTRGLRDVGRRRQPLRLRLARHRLRRPAAELSLRPRPRPQRLVPDEPDRPVRQRDHARLLQRPRQREPLLDEPLPHGHQLLDPPQGPARDDDAPHGQPRRRSRRAGDHEPRDLDRRGRVGRHDRALVALAGHRHRDRAANRTCPPSLCPRSTSSSCPRPRRRSTRSRGTRAAPTAATAGS